MKIKRFFYSKDFRKFILFSSVIFLGFLAGLNLDKLKNLSFSPAEILKNDGITAGELNKALSEKDFLLINVHTPYKGEIPKTDMFIEYNYLIANKDRLPEDKNTPIVVYCQSGRMSKEAQNTLKSLGYKNVKDLSGGMLAWESAGYDRLDLTKLPLDVFPEEGFELPISWGNLGKRLVDIGVIDLQKFEEAMNLTDEHRKILGGSDETIVINSQNSRFVVNTLWALGLAQESKVYEEGPMGKEYKDKIANFASTGGWTLARGEAVDYLGKYDLIPLTEKDHVRVTEIAKNIYRPCCGNNTWFPDCNHGMAALSAIELMVSAGLSDEEIYKNVLKLNTYWFPETYLQMATYLARLGETWSDVDAKMVLGESFSSSKGAGEIAKKVGPLPYDSGNAGGSCGA